MQILINLNLNLGDIASLIIALAAVLALFTGVKQLRSIGTLELFRILQDQKARDARGHLYRLDEDGKPLSAWGDKDYDAASHVCSTLDMTGMLLQRRFAPRDIFLRGYGGTIIKCHEAASDYLEHMRGRRGPDHWEHFDWLYEMARPYAFGKTKMA